MKYDAFISYARIDKPRIAKTVSELRSRGLNIWIDEEGIDGASIWRGEIVNALQNSASVIFFASNASCQSEPVEKELTIASEEKKKILPILIDKVDFPARIRYQLTGLQFIDGRADPAIVADQILRVYAPLAPELQTQSGQGITNKKDRRFLIAAAIVIPALILISTFWNDGQKSGILVNHGESNSENSPDNTPHNITKRALVIGNNDYLEASGLKNAINDAKAMTSFLERDGFEVTELLNVHSKLFMTRVRSHYAGYDVTRGIKIETKDKVEDPSKTNPEETAKKASARGVNIVFYTGHAIEVDGEVYLILVDANPQNQAEVVASGVRLTDILPEKYGVMPSDSFYLYSAEPGGLAIDEKGSNSPFTAALLTELSHRKSTLVEAFTAVRKAVQKETNGRQIPWMNLSGDTHLSLEAVNSYSGIASVVILDSCRDNPFPNER